MLLAKQEMQKAAALAAEQAQAEGSQNVIPPSMRSRPESADVDATSRPVNAKRPAVEDVAADNASGVDAGPPAAKRAKQGNLSCVLLSQHSS